MKSAGMKAPVAFTCIPLLLYAIQTSLVLGGELYNEATFGELSQFGLNVAGVDDDTLSEAREELLASTKREFVSRSGVRVLIVDDAVEDDLESFMPYVSVTSWWGFALTSRDGRDRDAGGDGVPWGARINAEDFMLLPIGLRLQLLATVYATSTSEGQPTDGGATDLPDFIPYEVSYKVVRRGDTTAVRYGTDEERSNGEVWMMIFLNYEWQSDNYGDLLIYDDNDEIVGGASNRLGRILMWRPGPDLGYLCRPPSIAFSQGENILMVKWTTNATKARESEARRRQDMVQIQAGIQDGFPFRSPSDVKVGQGVDVSTHEVVRETAQTGKRIVAFDGLFSDAELLALRSYVASHGKIFYDDTIDGYSDNVQWISGFEVRYFVQTKFWAIIRKVAMYVSEGNGDWYPYDVSCNIVRSYDHTRIHGDVRNDEDDEWTFLIYLSHTDINDYGETAYFTENDDDTEIVYQLRPQYGRAVIFEGLIPHSARPPSPKYKGPRYSFAVKMAKTPSRAIQHVLYEFMSQNSGLRSMAAGRESSLDPEEFVQSLARKYSGEASKLNSSLMLLQKEAVKWRNTARETILESSAEL